MANLPNFDFVLGKLHCVLHYCITPYMILIMKNDWAIIGYVKVTNDDK